MASADSEVTTRSDVGGVRSIARAVDVLGLFDSEHPTRSLRDIVALSGLPKTTAVRLLATLESLGLVAGLGESVYGLGPGLLRWVRLSHKMWEVSPEVRAMMTELVDQCGETVNIYVRQDLERLSVAQVEGTATVRSVVEVGIPYALAAGAAAKVLLTGAPQSVLERVARRRPSVRTSDLEREIAAIGEIGYAVTHGERELGASAVAAPIRHRDGRVLAALSASGPTSRFTAQRVAALVDAVTATANRISEVGLGSVAGFL